MFSLKSLAASTPKLTVWHNLRIAYRDSPDYIELIDELTEKFEELYKEEVLDLISKFMDSGNSFDSSSEEGKKELSSLALETSEGPLPAAPWEDGVCKVCGMDKNDDNVLLCDKCDSEYHTYCLDPPLPRIPDGNWYCPSCMSYQPILPILQDERCGTRALSRLCRKRKFQKEFTRHLLEKLAPLADTMELMEYWELGIEERVFLFKFLCDEALNSGVVRNHLGSESDSADLEKQLRKLYKELKIQSKKEEFLSSNLAKEVEDTPMQNEEDEENSHTGLEQESVSEVKNSVTSIQEKISTLELRIAKPVVRREYIGRDLVGRFYWIFNSPDRVVVSGPPSKRKAYASASSSFLSRLKEYEMTEMYPSDGSLWTCYESDAEIHELIGWLRDDDTREKDLKEAVKHWLSNRVNDDNTPQPAQGNHVTSSGYVTKARAVLETKFGSFVKKQGRKGKMVNMRNWYRCDCLELVASTRHHCPSCHLTFLTNEELESHNGGKCENRQEVERPSKRKKVLPLVKQPPLTAARYDETDSPFSFEEIRAKFCTRNSLREEVKDIGLIGSNGIPSFVNGGSTDIQSLEKQNTNETPSKADRSKPKGTSGKSSLKNRTPVRICQSSLKPLTGRILEIFLCVKTNLFDIETALPKEAFRPSRGSLDHIHAWRAFVKSAQSIYDMVQATIMLEDMIKTEHLKKEWWYWSSPATAAKISNLSALALRIYALDAAIYYDKPQTSNVEPTEPVTPKASKSEKKTSEKSNAKESSEKPIPKNNLSITDIKYVLNRKAFDIFCRKFRIPEDVHPQLPSPNHIIHEMPVGKIGFYTRCFEYANFRLPLSTFLVDILRYYHINISQLSVIATNKVSHFEILCRVHNIEPMVGLFRCFYVNSKDKGWMSFSKRPDSDVVCYTKPLDSLKHWNDHFFWVDSFACLASFPWHTGKNVSRDPFSKSTEFSADDYAILVARPAPFRKFSEPFLCLIETSRNYTLDEDTYPTFLHDDRTEMDLFAFIHVTDPTKVTVREWERAEGETRLLDSTVGRVVSLLPVAPARAKSELEASVERLFDEGGNADRGDSATGGGQKAETRTTMGVRIVENENVVAERPKRPHKKMQAVTDAGGSSHPTKKLRGTTELLVRPLLAVNLLSATPGHEDDNPTDSVTGANLHAIGRAERFFISPDSSHHSSTHAFGAEVSYVIRSVFPLPVVTEAVITTATAGTPSALIPDTSAKVNTPVHASMFHDLDFVGTVKSDVAGPSHLLGRELFIGSREVRMRTEYCLSERKRLELECVNQANLLKAKDEEVERLKAQLLLKEAERNVALETKNNSLDRKVTELRSSVSTKDLELKDLNAALSSFRSQNDGLVDQVHVLEATCSGLRERLSEYENLTDRLEEFQDAQLKVVNHKVAKLDADLAEMDCHLEEKFYPHLLTTISGRRWLLTHGRKLVLVKCLNSSEYLTTLGAAISCAIEKGMQNALATGIDHGREGRSLTDVVAYNPSTEADFNSALQELREIDFPLLSELKSHKDANVEDIMNLLRLEGPLADAPGMGDLQHDIEQLKVPIHMSEDQVVLGETSLSFSLSVSHSRVEQIRANIAAKRQYLRQRPTATVTTTALSTTLAFASSIPPITVDDYEIVHVDGQESSQSNVQGDAVTVKFEKEDLDTTSERDLIS
uniref:Methyl-CpG-binding domain-containing protein 9-like n=1 Tax=Tanacetum cinerariifolium TaxID=118510 RepID=A0A6L2L5J6_TANCI|nr:methyl-CpG-binding domain-containing protein 9-like [Tanacetum cinerariifolium]